VEIVLQGIGVSPGIAFGPALPFKVRALDVPKYEITDVDEERDRFEEALKLVRGEIISLRDRTEAQAGAHHAAIFDAHLLIAEDVELRREIEDRLASEKLNVEFLIDEYIQRNMQLMNSLNDAMFRERARDVHDVGRRIIEKLLRVEFENLNHLEQESIIIAHDLTPTDTAKLDIPNTLAIALDMGGATSHTAILARSFEIPAVVGLKRVGSYAFPGDAIIVDGTRGQVFVRPEKDTIQEHLERKQAEEADRIALIETSHDQPSVTLDDVEVPLLANIELPVEVGRCIDVQSQGVGLFRTEYLFLNRMTIPTEEEQYKDYVEVIEAMKPFPVTLRTLDLGGEKLAAQVQVAPEPNPQLGWRAIRLCMERMDIFKAQLRAMLRASTHGNLRIMIPLITGPDEFRRVKSIVSDVKKELDEEGLEYADDVPLGSMIEVPSAVAVADLLAKECDFFSIGTNDLVQYTLAVDRANEHVAHMFEQSHPAVLRMLRSTIKAAKDANIPVSVCGEMAGDPVYTELFIGLGVDELSMSPVSIPVVRAEVANARTNMAKRFARKVLGLGSISDVKTQLRKRYDKRRPAYWYLSQFERLSLDEAPAQDDEG
jgi:phosphotransferase system enzyme I (PtsI)